MRSYNRIPFGLRNGDMLEVSEVSSGLACGCVCPACNRKLQARKGNIRVHHFSHDKSEDFANCRTAYETSVHRMAKQIVDEERQIHLPQIVVRLSGTDSGGKSHYVEELVKKSQIAELNKVELEKRLDKIRPDIIAYVGNHPILIEVAVTSFASQKKVDLIEKLEIPAIEINLSSKKYMSGKKELKEHIYSENVKVSWLYHPEKSRVEERLKATLDGKIQDANSKLPDNKHKPILHANAYKQFKHGSLTNWLGLSSNRSPSGNISTHQESRERSRRASEKGEKGFYCQSCSHIFHIPRVKLDAMDSVACPKCGHLVTNLPSNSKNHYSRLK